MNIWKLAASRIFLAAVGFSAGALVAGGVVALIIGLGIIRRFVGISHTAVHAGIYETAICLGGIFGNIMTVHFPRLSLGWPGLLIMGLFSGIFVGGWIMALAEMLNVFPVFARRMGLTKGRSWIVIGLALGKVTGSLLEFYMRWGKK